MSMGMGGKRHLIAIGKKNGDHFDITPFGTVPSERTILEETLKKRLGSMEAMQAVMGFVEIYVNSERLLAQNKLLVQLNEDLKHGLRIIT